MRELSRRQSQQAAAGEPDPAGVALLERYSTELQELAVGAD
jgi:hypothetical protein